jgi:hypothetical protein
MMFSTTKPGLLKSFSFAFSVFSRRALPMVFMLAAGTLVVCQAQSGMEAPAPSKPADQPAKAVKPPFTLRVTNDQIIGISLKAEEIKLTEIAAELSRRLKIPVVVSTIMQKHRVTTNFSDLVLEPAMQMLAPQVYIDYEIDSTPGTQPRPLGIYFQGYNERAPADTAVVRGTSDVMVIEGNTEDVPDDKKDEEEGELKVTYDKGELSVKSKKQPLVVVLYGIANELGIPLEVKNEVLDLVTVNIQKSSVESVLQQLGSNIRLYVRADLQLQQRRPLRMVLVAPEKKS